MPGETFRLLEFVPDSIVVSTSDGIIEFVNEPAEHLFGYTRPELLGQSIDILLPERYRDIHRAHRKRYFKEPWTRHIGIVANLLGRRKDGTEFAADISLAPLKMNELNSVVAAVRDVTEARRQQAGLEALHEVAVSSGELLDPALLGRLVVDRACSLLGGRDAVLFWWDPRSARLRVLADNFERPFSRAMSAGEGAAGAAFQRGEMVVVEDYPNWEHALPEAVARGMKSVVAVPLRVRDRTVGALNLSFVTQRKFELGELRLLELLAAQAAPALEAATLHDAVVTMLNYQTVFESSPDPMWVEDAKSLAILAVNNLAVRRYGYSREEFLAMTALELRPPEEVPALLDMLARTAPDQRQSRLAIHRAKDGTVFEVETTFTPSVLGDRHVHIVMVQDVTEKRKRDQELAQAQRLESLGQLAGGVAHDFNNLLAVILNVTELLRKQALERDDPSWTGAARELERVDKAAQSASRLTRHLLAFARRQVVQPTVLDLSQQIGELTELLRRTIGSHIVLTANLSPDLWPVLMDSGHLEQVVINLAVNSRDAMPRGGTLSISTANVTLDGEDARGQPGVALGRYVRLDVSDSGMGMDKSTIEHAFEPFFTTKPVGQGTGLGLATVYGIVKQVGGHISIDSEPGRGTTVSILIPVTSQSPQVQASAAPVAHKDAAGTVLVVEDYGDLRDLIEEILKSAGYRVLTARDGIVGLELARSHSGEIDVLLTDVVMPQMLGPELAEQLRKENPQLRVLFMSGHAQPMLGNAAALEPGMQLLQKPFMASDLLEKMSQVLAAPRGGLGSPPR